MSREFVKHDSVMVKIKLDGKLLDRSFRNKGEAIVYLQRVKRVEKYEFPKRVQFINK